MNKIAKRLITLAGFEYTLQLVISTGKKTLCWWLLEAPEERESEGYKFYNHLGRALEDGQFATYAAQIMAGSKEVSFDSDKELRAILNTLDKDACDLLVSVTSDLCRQDTMLEEVWK